MVSTFATTFRGVILVGLMAGSLCAQPVTTPRVRIVEADGSFSGIIFDNGNASISTPANVLTIVGSSSSNGNILLQPGNVAANASVFIEGPRLDQPGLILRDPSGTTTGNSFEIRDHSNNIFFKIIGGTDATNPGLVVTQEGIFSGITSTDVTRLPGAIISGDSFISVTASSNASVGSLKAVAGNYFGIASSKTGSGSYLPIAFFTQALERARLTVDGGLLVGLSTTDVNYLPGAIVISDSFISTTGTANASVGSFKADSFFDTVDITSGRTGTGTFLPISFWTNNLPRYKISVDGGMYGNLASTDVSYLPGAFVSADSFISVTAATNASVGSFAAVAGSYVAFASSKTGSGTYLPMSFFTSATRQWDIDTSGNFVPQTTNEIGSSGSRVSKIWVTDFDCSGTCPGGLSWSNLTDMSTPATGFRIYGAQEKERISIDKWGGSTFPGIYISHSNGTEASPTVPVNADPLGIFSAGGWDGSAYQRARGWMSVIAIGTWSGINNATQIDFWATDVNSTVPRKTWSIQASGSWMPNVPLSYNIGDPSLRVADYYGRSSDLSSNLAVGGTLGVTGTLSFSGAIYGNLSSTDVSYLPGAFVSADSFISVTAATNASVGSFAAVASNYVAMASSKTGSGTYLPLTFFTNSSERFRITVDGALYGHITSTDVSYNAGAIITDANFVSVTATSNASVGSFAAIAGSYVAMASSRTGSGTFLPLSFFTNATRQWDIDTNGNFIPQTTNEIGSSGNPVSKLWATAITYNGNTGAAATVTVRNSAGTGTCNIVFSVGGFISTTC